MFHYMFFRAGRAGIDSFTQIGHRQATLSSCECYASPQEEAHHRVKFTAFCSCLLFNPINISLGVFKKVSPLAESTCAFLMLCIDY